MINRNNHMNDDTSVAQQTTVQLHPSEKPVYVETFFIVPRYILNLDGVTFSFLKVYETIFQFWNKGLTCFLSNSKIEARTGVSERQIQKALKYFEKHDQLKRVEIDGKRYLVRPEQVIQIEPKKTPPPCSVGHPPPVPGATHNIKKVNKEDIKEKIYKKEKSSPKKKGKAQESSCTEKNDVGLVGSNSTGSKEREEMAVYQEVGFMSNDEFRQKQQQPQNKTKQISKKANWLTANDMGNLNPHNIPIEMLQDWIEVRRAKNSPVTPTAWSRLTNQLSKCKDPVEAFEIMVTQGWVGMNHTWIANFTGEGKDKVVMDDELESTDWVDRV